jgi:tetratricopeptide (TPR) repeat protein
MAEKRKPGPKKETALSKSRDSHEPRHKAADGIGIRRVSENKEYELVHPRAARDRKDDLDEVHAMLDAGEFDVAIDELRWLLGGCNVLLEAHRLLGEIALGEEDLILARNHFGFAYEMGLEALGPKFSGTLPYARKANRAFFEAGKGLAWSLKQLGEPKLAKEVADELLALDPTDPLNLMAMLKIAGNRKP